MEMSWRFNNITTVPIELSESWKLFQLMLQEMTQT